MTSARQIVLLGDSIFDNASYVPGGPDVVNQVRALLPDHWRASLNAVDGRVASDVKRQTGWLTSDITHLVVSVGGNDALNHSGLLERDASSVAQALHLLATAREQFAEDYRAMLHGVWHEACRPRCARSTTPAFPIRRRAGLPIQRLRCSMIRLPERLSLEMCR